MKKIVDLVFKKIEKESSNVNLDWFDKVICENFPKEIDKIRIKYFPEGNLPEIKSLKLDAVRLRNIPNELWINNTPQFIPDPNCPKDDLINLLYAVIWKNGDINKVKHIYTGVINSDISHVNSNETDVDITKAIVFKQFGAFLSNSNSNPIIDQHVLRAFSFYLGGNEINKMRDNLSKKKEITDEKLLSKSTYNDKLGILIKDEYIKWFKKLEINNFETNRNIDKVLFSLGKIIKIS
jgi:hypothetical protein